jgi:anti-sigma B factor antagonist
MQIEMISSLEPSLRAGVVDVKEGSLSLSLEASKLGEAVVLHCKGRIVFRDEVVELSKVVGHAVQRESCVILDLHGVSAIDSAGLGELVALHMWAQGNACTLKMTGLSSRIRRWLELTNLTSVFEIYATEADAVGEVA